ncbi:ATP synthase subunit delta, sodium ion specific [Polystyrenella longa]|uniref:ATP synthase subunit delta n=1 Tax=Polystyrenella longa TaxID=2528007 RepID=A0A518CHP0_9PLAN|nr:ATP synthase F1 subunit delta [Polystyrenella longa]QDU78743.1 ATP synthase subunit delta, sodium ion specific [Polystyrenella longa]
MASQKSLKTKQQSVLADPSAQAIARVYAEAFLGAAAGNIDEAMAEYESFLTEVLDKDARFEKLLTTQALSREEKSGLIDRMLGQHGSSTFGKFLKVLAQKNRVELFRGIYAETVELNNQRQGKKRVFITTARPLNNSQLTYLSEKLSAVLPFQPVLETDINKDLIGGLTIRVGNTVYDGSLRTRLKKLRGQLRERGLHEIQSGRDRFCNTEGN